MNASNELRVWASHLANQSLTVIDRAVPFDSAGRSAVLTPEEFNSLCSIPCFATDGPTPSIHDFLPSAYTAEDWLCCVGLSPVLVKGFTLEQQEALALGLYSIGGLLRLDGKEFAAAMGSRGNVPIPLAEELFSGEVVGPEVLEESFDFGPPQPLIEGHATDCVCTDCGQEWLKANLSDDPTPLTVSERVEAGFQHPDAAGLLGLEEPEGTETDMVEQFKDLKAASRAEFVAEDGLTRSQLDTLFNVEQGTKGLKSPAVLSALVEALHRLPNPTAENINAALVKASAKE